MKKINICSIALGVYHSLALDSQGQLFAFGSSLNGQRGVETDDNLPQPIPELNNCVHIMCGGSFSLLHLADQRVLVFRYLELGQQGEDGHYPTENPDFIGKILITGLEHVLVGDSDGNLSCQGVINYNEVPPSTGIKLRLPPYLKKNYGKKSRAI